MLGEYEALELCPHAVMALANIISGFPYMVLLVCGIRQQLTTVYVFTMIKCCCLYTVVFESWKILNLQLSNIIRIKKLTFEGSFIKLTEDLVLHKSLIKWSALDKTGQEYDIKFVRTCQQ